MTYKLTYQPENGIAIVTVSGKMGLKKTEEMILDAVTRAEEQGIAKLLVDIREMNHELSVTQIYTLPRTIVNKTKLTHMFRVAILLSASLNKMRDFQIVSDNPIVTFPFIMKSFTELDEALTWLTDN